MAFLIFVLSFQQAFIGWGGIKVKAEGGSSGTLQPSTTINAGTAAARVTDSEIVKGAGEYTGQFYPGTITLYDYMSDNEVKSQERSSFVSKYTDAYTFLNSAISNYRYSYSDGDDYIKYEADDNITIKYTSARWDDDDNVYVKFWDSTDTINPATSESYSNTNNPGILMTHVSDNVFKCTFNPTDLGFIPDTLYFHDNRNSNNYEQLTPSEYGLTCYFDNTSLTTYETINLTSLEPSLTMAAGNTYEFQDAVDNTVKIAYKKNEYYGDDINGKLYLTSDGEPSGWTVMPKSLFKILKKVLEENIIEKK